MDRRLVKTIKRGTVGLAVLLMTGLFLMFCRVLVYADDSGEQETEGLVIESAQAALPEITAYIRNDYQIGVTDISATLDGRELVVGNVDFFENKNQGVTYYVLLDVSASFSASYFRALQNSLVTFRNSLSDKDKLVLITFGSSVQTVLDGEETPEEAQEAIMALSNGDNDTFFYEALLQAAEETDKNTVNSREVIMMISDGGDDHNAGKANAQEAISALNKRNIPVYGYAAGANQNNMQSFKELADACGGIVTEFTSQETDKIFSNFTRMLKEMQVVTLLADSNIVSNKTEKLQITILSDGSNADREVLITEHIPDEISPEIIAVRQYGENELIVNFSEPVSGADIATAYTITCDGVILDVMTAEYNPYDYSAIIGFNNVLDSGEYVIEVRAVTDISMECNPVMESFTKVISNANRQDEQESTTEENTETMEENTEQTSVEEQTGDDDETGFWDEYGRFIIIGVILLVLLAAGGITYAVISKRHAEKKMEEARHRVEKSLPNTQSNLKQSEIQSRNKTVQLKMEPGRKIIFEILNVEAGENSRVEAELNKSMIVGRADICDVSIKDKRISRQHFALEDKDGVIYIRDLQTTNGTSVNGVMLKGVKQLNNNDIISAGSVKLRIRW